MKSKQEHNLQCSLLRSVPTTILSQTRQQDHERRVKIEVSWSSSQLYRWLNYYELCSEEKIQELTLPATRTCQHREAVTPREEASRHPRHLTYLQIQLLPIKPTTVGVRTRWRYGEGRVSCLELSEPDDQPRTNTNSYGQTAVRITTISTPTRPEVEIDWASTNIKDTCGYDEEEHLKEDQEANSSWDY